MLRLIIDSIRSDPEWMDGNYTKQPRSAQLASVFYGLATSGGNHALHAAAPTREKADQLLDQRLASPFTADANDVLYQWDSSRDYNPSPGLERIQAVLLAINSADDERNPPELGILEQTRPLSDPGERGHARPRHHRPGEILEAPPGRATERGAPGDEVGNLDQLTRAL
jgi:homoserine O-acetyltransferase